MTEKESLNPPSLPELYYETGYDRGAFDILFDLKTFLYGEEQDAIKPKNMEAFKRLGLKHGMLRGDETSPNVPQPPPSQGRTPITPLVIADLQQRSEIGREKYGTELMSFNGRDALLDAYQEALDLAVYLRQVIEEGR